MYIIILQYLVVNYIKCLCVKIYVRKFNHFSEDINLEAVWGPIDASRCPDVLTVTQELNELIKTPVTDGKRNTDESKPF